jgi:hypothetical protein
MTSSIGNNVFVNISARPAAPQEGVQLESQAGVNGVTAWLVGSVGKTQTITSFRDCVNFADALNHLAAYELTSALGPLAITYGGVLLPFGVKVLSVEPLEVKQIMHGVGGVLGQSGAILRARWSIITWKVP